MIHSGFFHITRFPSHEVTIGNRPMGGRNPIRLQSMTNTNTLDIEATVKQCIRIIEAGADYVRMSAPNVKAAHALKEISDRIRKAGFTHPLIADIHFNPEVALIAARYVEKVRINPGNYYSVPSASHKI
ncbi:MAG: flavodoxin-dependent (E)-4-hydroxy-3-methylbut-2-enyl-diphosphate synthase, partial [Bacteroidota bacterium]